ncbi:MAG: HD domain-containing protein [Coriobacteriia bacterium]|nr:HD domain-containing protein [Coriobacteriia bacterium]
MSSFWPLAVLFGLTVILAHGSLELPFAASLSFTFAPIFAGVLFAGPVGGAVLGLAGAVTLQEVRERKPAWRILFNVCQLFLAGLVAGLAYAASGGQQIPVDQLHSVTLIGALIAPAIAVAVFFSLNLLLVGIAVSLDTGMGWKETLNALGPGSYWVSLLVLALLGYVMAHLIGISSWFGLLLLVLPFAMARQTFRVYVELTEAYTETVRSLVAAIEAKDRYTRGHSERVAIHARQLAASLGFSSADVGLAERAALLHDVGKIGISQTTLTSPVQLTPAEVRQIRRHPVIGADLTQDVAFLSDVVPIVRHHHERVDGAGYPDGLVGPEIPMLARVLAVVDSYDAMTSDRAYRPGMSDDDARVELKRVAGSQLDTRVVTAFTALLDEPSAEVDDQ